MEVKSTFDVKYVLLHGQFIYIYIYSTFCCEIVIWLLGKSF